MDHFSQACKDFGPAISPKKINVLGQDTLELPAITIDDYELDVVEQFTYLGSTITDDLSLDTEIDKRIGKAATTLARLTSRVDQPQTDSEDQDGSVQCPCRQHTDVDHICQTGEKTQFLPLEKHSRILGISWQDRVSNTEVLSRANLPSMFTLHRQRRLRWLGPWRMAASQKTFCMESWHVEREPKSAHNCTTRMSARET